MMLSIDGSSGEGGGQILRTALALSMTSGTAFRIVNIRARRKRPGLRPQHLAAVRAAAEVCRAEVSGADVGASMLTFVPGAVAAGHYEFSIGTAGSATLVLQTVLPALMLANGPSRVAVEGGTHNPLAPTYDFLAKAYLPLVERMGPGLGLAMPRPGFYPRGGGRLVLEIKPAARLAPLQLEARGSVKTISAEILLSKLPSHIADREAGVVAAALPIDPAAIGVRRVRHGLSAGNAVTIVCECEHVTEVFAAVGQRGVRAEAVAAEAADAASRYLDADVPVGPHLADQLLVPIALAREGSFVTTAPTRHTLTNIGVIEQFLDLRVECVPLGDSARWRVRCRP